MKVELHRRSLLKAGTYRLAGTVITWIIGWYFTGSLWTGLGIGLADSFLKLGSYYIHERLWHRISWGTVDSDPANCGGGI